MKKIIFILFIIPILLTGCFSDEDNNKEYINVIFYDSDNTTIIQESEILVGEDAVFEGLTPKLIIEGKNCVFVDWDKPLINILIDTEFYPVFDVEDIYYTVEFYNEGKLFDSVKVKHGDSLEYDKIPTINSTEYYDYEFIGWVNNSNKNLLNIESDLKFYAKYNTDRHSYDVHFKNDDGTILESQIIKKGEYASCDIIPSKEPVEEGVYEFIGFTPNPQNTIIEQNTSFVAQFKLIKHEYEVVYKNEDGSIIYTETVNHGDKCNFPLDKPTKESDDSMHHYVFKGWITEGDYNYYLPVKENREFIVNFGKYINEYTVEFLNQKTRIETVKIKHGELVSPIENLKGPNDGYTRDFLGWDYDFNQPITSDTKIYALWSEWYYTKDGLGVEYLENGYKDYSYNVKCGNLFYKTFLITGKTLNLKLEDESYCDVPLVGVSEKGFYNNDTIQTIVFDDISTLVTINYQAFAECDNLEVIILNEYITRIEDEAFRSCDNIELLYLPASLEYLGDGCFIWSNIQELFYGGTKEQWDDIYVDGNARLNPEITYYYSEEEPTGNEYNYWHYVDGEMTPWE